MKLQVFHFYKLFSPTFDSKRGIHKGENVEGRKNAARLLFCERNLSPCAAFLWLLSCSWWQESNIENTVAITNNQEVHPHPPLRGPPSPALGKAYAKRNSSIIYRHGEQILINKRDVEGAVPYG